MSLTFLTGLSHHNVELAYLCVSDIRNSNPGKRHICQLTFYHIGRKTGYWWSFPMSSRPTDEGDRGWAIDAADIQSLPLRVVHLRHADVGPARYVRKIALQVCSRIIISYGTYRCISGIVFVIYILNVLPVSTGGVTQRPKIWSLVILLIAVCHQLSH